MYKNISPLLIFFIRITHSIMIATFFRMHDLHLINLWSYFYQSQGKKNIISSSSIPDTSHYEWMTRP